MTSTSAPRLDPPAVVPYYGVRYNDTELAFNADHVGVAKVRQTPSWPGGWASLSL